MKRTNINSASSMTKTRFTQQVFNMVVILALFLFTGQMAKAHCDSYDGPVLKDARTALENNNVDRVLKWINKDQEQEIIELFQKTYKLKNGDQEIYAIVKKHFFETLVRLHRETEGAPYTGLKPAGSAAPIIQKADLAIENKCVDQLTESLSQHIEHVIEEKFERVVALNQVKNNSVAEGREYVKAYVDYTHTLEGIKKVLEHGMIEHSKH